MIRIFFRSFQGHSSVDLRQSSGFMQAEALLYLAVYFFFFQNFFLESHVLSGYNVATKVAEYITFLQGKGLMIRVFTVI